MKVQYFKDTDYFTVENLKQNAEAGKNDKAVED